MSEETKAAVDEAVRAHIAEEADEPLIVTDWYVVTASASAEGGVTHYHHICTDTPWHTLLGLVHRAWQRMSSWEDLEDD